MSFVLCSAPSAVQTFRYATWMVSALTGLACLSGCATESQVETSADEVETSADEVKISRARPLLQGSYKSETLYSRNPAEGEKYYNPPRLQAHSRPLVTKAHSRGFQLDFRTPDGESVGYIPIDCVMLSGTPAFVCNDQLGEGPPPGMILDGNIIPAFGGPRPIQARVFQRIGYSGVVVDKRQFMTTLTITTTCEGSTSECEALGEWTAQQWGSNILGKSPTTVVERNTLIE